MLLNVTPRLLRQEPPLNWKTRTDLHDQLGHIYLQQGALDDSQREFERAVALAPESGAYHFLLGQVYRRQGKVSLSQAEFKRAQELNGSHSSAP